MRDAQRAEMLDQFASNITDLLQADDDLLLDEAHAVAYTRGYTADYLTRTIQNRGTAAEPRYRKGDLPRRMIAKAITVHRAASGRIRAFGDVE